MARANRNLITTKEHLLLFHSSLYLLPSMCTEKETVSHAGHHWNETTERYGETQFIFPYPRTYRWVEKSQKASMALPFVLHHRHGNNGATTRTEKLHHGIRLVVVVESPSAQSRQHVGCGKEKHSFRALKR